MRIIAVLNHKGGVGKTTFTGSTAQALALCGLRVCAIDNDSQHNLSTLLGVGVKSPSIQDIYRASSRNAAELLLQSIRKTECTNLHIITANGELCDGDIHDIRHLATTIGQCRLERFYDVVLIDNAPGLNRLQGSAIMAADEIFVPVELRQFAVDGLVEMEHLIDDRYPGGAKISRIIPNFFKNTKRQRAFLSALASLFPGKVTRTSIPLDSVFDELVTEGKILFLHRLYSNGASVYLKIIHELFGLDEETAWKQMMDQRSERIKNEARQRFFERTTRESTFHEK